MKNFLLMLLGKGTNESIDDSVEGVFKSECYYDWIKLKVISKSENSSENSPEGLLVASYNEEIISRQKTMNNDLHVQQGIIALPADAEDEESSYNDFLIGINNTSIVFISFINVPSWSQKEREEIISSATLDKHVSVNEVIKMKILEIIDNSSMRLFYTFDHNDFVMICNGEKTELKDYFKTLEKIRFILVMDKYFAVHDITTIYGYKSKNIDKLNTTSSISAVISISGPDIVPSNVKSSFRMETVGRYDHLSGYKDFTWHQLSKISKKLHGDNVITSRVHIGCDLSDDLTIAKYDTKLPRKKISTLYHKFEDLYKNEIRSINFTKLAGIYDKDIKYVDSIKLMLNEIGLAISTTLKRGFSKYNSVCYIEAYIYFIKYIKDKIIGEFCKMSENASIQKDDIAKDLAEVLVDISNAFYKSILTLDSSIMHSERRFIMSDPHQLMLFDVPPKLIAYYTSIASEMARTLNENSNNKYVFLITPDIKKDIYIESITDNRDIDDEINILVIHINERNIYNVTDTTRNLAHEIAHHVGQDKDLRKIRACCFIKCYIALLIKSCLDPDLFSNQNSIDNTSLIIEKLSENIFTLVENSDFLDDINNYYYMDILQEKFHLFLIKKLSHVSKINPILYEIFSKCFDNEVITSYVRKSECFFVDIDNVNLSSDTILKEFVFRLILETAYKELKNYFQDSEQVIEDMKCIRFVFKEGYADVQMILLTENLNLNISKIIKNYSQNFESVKDKTDEMMRKCAVVNAFLEKEDRHYDGIADLDLIKKDNILNRAYFMYICKQATLYFEKFKYKNFNNRLFDYSKTLLFKTSEVSEIIQQVDNTIASYIESIL